MAKLILSFENTVLKTVPLNRERVLIGRRPDNDIQVDNLAVSGLHAIVTTILNDSVIEDQNSTNGTMVNGQLVQKHLLQNHDVIEIGKHKIKYLVEGGAPAYQDFAKTMVIRKTDAAPPAPASAPTASADHAAHPAPVSMDPPTIVAAPPAPSHAPTQPHLAALKVLSGASAGRILELNKNLTTIGKAGVQVVVFTRRPIGYFVTHVEGDVAPLINGTPLGSQAMQLSDQDTVDIAGTKMRFFYKT